MATITSDQKRTKPVSRDMAGAMWLMQTITGALLILLLGLHMIAHHYVVEGGLRTYQDVLDYISNPIIFVLEVLFLIAVVPHAMLGLQAIILDLGPSESARRTIEWVMRILTIAILAYGIWLAFALQNMA